MRLTPRRELASGMILRGSGGEVVVAVGICPPTTHDSTAFDFAVDFDREPRPGSSRNDIPLTSVVVRERE